MDVVAGSHPALIQIDSFAKGLTGWLTRINGTATGAFSVDAGSAAREEYYFGATDVYDAWLDIVTLK